jgi:RNA polymerase sigma-70 factor (ECF subfamily)
MNDQRQLTHNEKYSVFEKEFFPHADALYNFAFHLTYDDENANDLVQETFLKAWRFIESYDRGTNAKAWLFKILKNTFINEYRRKVRQPSRADFEKVVKIHEDDENPTYIGGLDTRQDAFKGMVGDELTRAINQLPVDFRTAIILCDLEDFKYDEIAKILDIPIGTVRSRLHRARNMLKDMLKEYAKTLGYQE